MYIYLYIYLPFIWLVNSWLPVDSLSIPGPSPLPLEAAAGAAASQVKVRPDHEKPPFLESKNENSVPLNPMVNDHYPY